MNKLLETNKLVLWHVQASDKQMKIYLLEQRDVWKKDKTLQWRHDGHDNVSNHQPHDCLLNRLFRRRWKKTSRLRVARTKGQ